MTPLLDVTLVFQRLAHLPVETRQPGELLLSAGSSTGRLFILREGLVEVVRDGVQIAVIGEPGAVFGDLAVLLCQPHSADVRALAPSTFSVADGRTCLLINPVAALHVAMVLAQRLDAVDRQLVEVKAQLNAGGRRREVGAMLDDLADTARYSQPS